MQLQNPERIKKSIIPWLLLVAIISYALFLASSIQSDVFYQGDGGMKFMVIKQINAGQGFKYLDLPHEAWVKEIWQQGFFPVKEPFLYKTAVGYVVSFPPGFQLASAFFYKYFGYSGLYILPLFSMLTLWYWVYAVLKKSGINSSMTALGIFVLVFCSPLTIYGFTYWEHMPAVCLLFAGIAYVVIRHENFLTATIFGFLSGLAVWLRPEALVVCFLYSLSGFILYLKEHKKSYWFFVAGMVLSIGSFLLFNKINYDSFLGVHGYQVLENNSLYSRLVRVFKNELKINWLLLKFFPFTFFVAVLFWELLKKRKKISLSLQLLAGIVTAFPLLAPFMLPNTGGGQWGPRYFLPVIPFIVVLLLLFCKEMEYSPFREKLLSITLLLMIVFSFYLNVYKGGFKELRQGNYTRIKPALEFIKQQEEKAIIVNTEHIPMEMGSVFKTKNFFLAEDTGTLRKLIQVLKKKGITEVVYINERNESPGINNLYQPTGTALIKIGNYYFGKFTL